MGYRGCGIGGLDNRLGGFEGRIVSVVVVFFPQSYWDSRYRCMILMVIVIFTVHEIFKYIQYYIIHSLKYFNPAASYLVILSRPFHYQNTH